MKATNGMKRRRISLALGAWCAAAAAVVGAGGDARARADHGGWLVVRGTHVGDQAVAAVTLGEAFAEMDHFGAHRIWQDLRNFVRSYKPLGKWAALRR
jgi:hypothetical protein